MSEKLIYAKFNALKDDIQKKVLAAVTAEKKEAGEKLRKDLEDQKAESRLKIAFVGQHNSGKSTIISALTGNREIKISNDVETDSPADYEWQGLLLTDTPGLYAGKKEEHDKMSLQKIKESDILVFCITSSLFDDLLIRNFVEMAYRQAYKSKIFLLVNKMSGEAGVFEELKKNYSITLDETLRKEGGNFKDFPVSFIDAKDFIDGLEDKDNGQELIEYSHFNSFVEELNKYVGDKKLLAKLDAPCRIMIGAIDQEISNTSTEVDKNMMALLRRSESVVMKYKNDVKFYICDAERDLRSAIMSVVNALINRIGVDEIGQYECDNVNKEIENITQKAIVNIQNHIDEAQKSMILEIGDILNSEQGNFVMQQIKCGNIDVNGVSTDHEFAVFAAKYNNLAKIGTDASGVIISSVGGAENLAKMTTVSGTALHSTVFQVGKFFGVNFKPWQAVGIASKIGKVAAVLGPVLAGIGVVIDVVSAVKESERNSEIQEAKRETFNQFSDISSDIASKMEEQYRQCEAALFDSMVDEIENVKRSIIRNNNHNSDYVKKLKKYHEELYSLIREMAKV